MLLGKSLPRIKATKQQQQDTLHQIEAAKKEIGKPFEFEDRLSQFVVRQSEINSALEFKKLQVQAEMDESQDGEQNVGFERTQRNGTIAHNKKKDRSKGTEFNRLAYANLQWFG